MSGTSSTLWITPVIPALGRLRQEDSNLEVNLGYRTTPCLKEQQQQKKKTETKTKLKSSNEEQTEAS
jgi:hypothetical protein